MLAASQQQVFEVQKDGSVAKEENIFIFSN